MSEQEIIDDWLNMRQQQPIQLATQEAYWQQVRITIAAHIAGGLAQRGVFSATKTVEWTDALIEELQKGGQDE